MAEAGKSVLLADDDLTLSEMYSERLKAEGFNVIVARDGQEALDKTKESHPNVILLDVMMPKFSGIEVLKKLKADPETKDIPILILTALVQDKQKMDSMASGADDYIVKSESMPGDVVAKVHAALENHKG
jgi:DNA-binding response OmpR family regulator